MLRLLLPLLVALVWLAGLMAHAQEGRPRVPPGRDPGGVAVGLISTGIDYTLPAVAARLARDGEGELIAWDLESSDNRPFDRSRGTTSHEWGGDATAIASALASQRGLRLVPVRIVPADPLSLARAVAFVAQTPARIVIVPMATSDSRDWDGFGAAAARFKDTLFLAAAGERAEPVYPSALELDNILVVHPQSGGSAAVGFGGAHLQLPASQQALVATAGAAAAIIAAEPRIGAAALKKRLQASSTAPGSR